METEGAIATLVNVVAREQDCRELLGGEEFLGPQVRVALRLPGIDRRRLDHGLDVPQLRVLRVELRIKPEGVERAPDGAHHHVANREADGRVAGVEAPERHARDSVGAMK